MSGQFSVIEWSIYPNPRETDISIFKDKLLTGFIPLICENKFRLLT